MKKILIMFLILFITCSFTAHATDSYSFLSGGYQLTRVAQNGMGQYFNDRYNNSEGSKDLHGLYFRGSWNFYGNFFAEYRSGITTRSSTTLKQDYLAFGYYIPLKDQTSIYASAGYASYNAERDVSSCNIFTDNDCTKSTFEEDDNGFSAEVGLRYKLLRWLQIEPSYRYADFGQHEVRLTNLIEFSQHSALELNTGYRHWEKLDENYFQVGYRYSF